jgi:hypothetical protein
MVRRRIAKIALVACLAAATAAGGQRALAAEPPAVEPAAERLLRAALERIAAAKTFSFIAEIASDTALPSGQRVQYTGRIETAVRRPDGLRISLDGEQRSTRSWYDGKTYTLLDVGQNVYACWPGPGRLEDLLDTMKERLGFSPPLSLLLHEDVATKAFTRIQRGFTVGPATLGGVAVQHLAFGGEKNDWQLWVTEGPEPVIRRIVITFKREEGSPQFSASFLAWDFGPRIDDGLFSFAPPAGAMQCDFRLMKQ